MKWILRCICVLRISVNDKLVDTGHIKQCANEIPFKYKVIHFQTLHCTISQLNFLNLSKYTVLAHLRRKWFPTFNFFSQSTHGRVSWIWVCQSMAEANFSRNIWLARRTMSTGTLVSVVVSKNSPGLMNKTKPNQAISNQMGIRFSSEKSVILIIHSIWFTAHGGVDGENYVLPPETAVWYVCWSIF